MKSKTKLLLGIAAFTAAIISIQLQMYPPAEYYSKALGAIAIFSLTVMILVILWIITAVLAKAIPWLLKKKA